eukprot:GHVU01123870.1.p2 GENE.GHVU01123870.1~~GHVU01123870.1.p2  ORF type:complete len:185 (-),score=18.06 GHVU01123870.1:952-1506(-)
MSSSFTDLIAFDGDRSPIRLCRSTRLLIDKLELKYQGYIETLQTALKLSEARPNEMTDGIYMAVGEVLKSEFPQKVLRPNIKRETVEQLIKSLQTTTTNLKEGVKHPELSIDDLQKYLQDAHNAFRGHIRRLAGTGLATTAVGRDATDQGLGMKSILKTQSTTDAEGEKKNRRKLPFKDVPTGD